MTENKFVSGAVWWAVDPFQDTPALHEHALKVLAPFARALSTVICPVTYVDLYHALDETAQQSFPVPQKYQPLSALYAEVEKRLARLSEMTEKGLAGPPIVLTHEPGSPPSLRDKVDTIGTEAMKHSAAFVALHSHSRGWLERFFMGSFAETFMLHGVAPLLVFNPTCAATPQLRRAMFPTDLSPESSRACLSFQDLCLKLGVRLSLANVQPWYASLKSLHPDMRAEVEAQMRDMAREAEELVAQARGRGVDAEAVALEASDSDRPSVPILAFAIEHQVDLIALAAQSGPIMTALVGATSRSIAREAHCPVLIYRSITAD